MSSRESDKSHRSHATAWNRRTKTVGEFDGQHEIDERMASLAQTQLGQASLGAWVRHIHVSCHDATLCVEGHLPSFYLKQLVQTILLRVPGCRGVDNRVAVDRT